MNAINCNEPSFERLRVRRHQHNRGMNSLTGVVAVLLLLLFRDASAEVVAFADGTQVLVQSYEFKGDRVVMTTLDGTLQSVPRRHVDLEATERMNGSRKRPASPSQSVANDPRPLPTPAEGTLSLPTKAALEASWNASPSSTPLSPRIARTAFEQAALTTRCPAAASASTNMLPSFSPPAPSAPEVMVRDDEGRITLRATCLTEPIVLDGKLDEPVYSQVKAITDFIQQEPNEGEPGTEKTEAWIFFDNLNFYVAVRCWDSHPERMVANEMRRDNGNIPQNENISMVVDTDYDRRNGFYFAVNPLGALRDQAVGDEGESNNIDWNTVWDAKVSSFDQGWTLEMAIPFKSLRFRNAGPQVWSFNLRRTVAWKNERQYLAPIAAAHQARGVFRFSDAATLIGVEVPGSNRTLEIKPYGVSSLTTDQTADQPFSNHPGADYGLDAKYGVTQGLIADFTYNTDFAQIEEDEQEVNLTRFSLFFPEKRDFFLEGQSIFAFGGVRQQSGGSSTRPGSSNTDLTPVMFFSRRIGLTEEGIDPIRVGGRLTGRAGRYRIGALNIQTRGIEANNNSLFPATNFSVLRIRRDVLRRSDIGVIATYRNTSPTEGASSNMVFGFDGNFAFYENLRLNAYYAVSRTTLEQGGRTGGDDSSYTGKFDYAADRYGLVLEHLYVGENFQPELGFLPRDAFRRNFVQARFSPRPRSIEAIRQVWWQGEFDYITDPGGRPETKRFQGQFRIDFENADQARVEYTKTFEALPEEFEIADGVILPVDTYRFQDVNFLYTFGAPRPVPSTISFRTGSFFNGDRQEATFKGRVELSPKFSVEPRLSLNWVDLPEGAFTTRLISARLNYTFTPRMFVSSLIQYNTSSDSLSSSVRFRWEYEPGSDFFVVYSEGRDELSVDPFLATRTFAVKFTKLLRF